MIIADIFIHHSFQMTLVEHNHMVEKIASAAAHEPFGHAVLPGAANRGPSRRSAQTFYGFQNLAMKSVLAIKRWNAVARCRMETLLEVAEQPKRSSGAV